MSLHTVSQEIGNETPQKIMKTVLILSALVAVVIARPQETYNPVYDNFDANQLTSNVRLLKNYAKCFLDQGPCTAEGSDFKKVIPEALQTTCAKCSPKQKELIRVVVKALEEKLPELWKELVKKQDPQGRYAKSFQDFINGSN